MLKLQSLPPALVSLVCCSLFYDCGFSWTSLLQKNYLFNRAYTKAKTALPHDRCTKSNTKLHTSNKQMTMRGKYFYWKLFLIQKQYYTCTKNKFYGQTMMHFVEEICLNKMEIFLLTHLFSHSSRSMDPCKRTDQINQ